LLKGAPFFPLTEPPGKSHLPKAFHGEKMRFSIKDYILYFAWLSKGSPLVLYFPCRPTKNCPLIKRE
jgi:hypothetical protein